MLHILARHGRMVLVIGLVLGILAPSLAQAMVPMIFPMIVLLLFLSTLRVDVGRAFPDRRALPGYLGIMVLLQIGLPVLMIALLWGIGAMGSILGVGAVLVLAAAPMTGSPGLTILAGGDPAPALRQLVLGTALLPLTVIAVFWLLPVFGSPLVVAEAAARLLAVIALAGGAGMILRRWLRGLSGQTAVDGGITLAMALVVIALMSAVGPALLSFDSDMWVTLAVACGLNFGTQIGAFFLLRRGAWGQVAPALAIIAGNRNVALFLGALPPETGTALLLYIGCYQVPMYLTPLIMGPPIRRV